MNTRRISYRARWLHKMLITGIASCAMLGILSGCQSSATSGNGLSNTSIDLQTRLTNHRIAPSTSLSKLVSDQFKTAYVSNASDVVLHNHHVGASDASPSDSPVHYSDYFFDDKQGYDIYTSKAHQNQKVDYHINNRAKTITFSSNHVDNSLATITYKLIGTYKSSDALSSDSGSKVYEFEPIHLRRFGHEHSAYVPKAVAKHNILRLKPTYRIHSKMAHSLNSVQRK